MTLAAIAVAATMNAQVWVGGELGYKASHLNGSDNTEKVLTIAPEVGYNFNDKFALAVKLGYEYASTAEVLGDNFENVNSYVVNPYVRFTFAKVGNFSAFVDGGASYTTSHIKDFDDNVNAVGVAVTPGIAYAVSPKVTLVSHLGEGLYYQHSWIKDFAHANDYGFNLFNGISFGAYYNF